MPSKKTSQTPCNFCHGNKFKLVFLIATKSKRTYKVVNCKQCNLLQVNPQPPISIVKPFYHDSYFLNRTDRGYNNYYSKQIQDQILKVYEQNLKDLCFFPYEETLKKNSSVMKALDVGCASGYFVEWLQNRNWEAEGIELADRPAQEGRKKGLSIHTGNFLTSKKLKKNYYDLLSFWASIEHMNDPYSVFLKSASLLKKEGHLLLSTCRYGLLAKWRGRQWRFMNVPEHLYFFTLGQIKAMARKAGFKLVRSISYGSGFTTKKNMSLMYKISKKLADQGVKLTNQGDMMALHFIKER